MNLQKTFTNGLLKENPVLIQLLGCCPTLGVSTSVMNALGMGIASTFVLVMSNILISMIKDFIPDKVRIPAYIVVIASFVTVVDLVMSAYFPVLYRQLGIFIPLIVVNCIILGRAEAFAAKNGVLPSMIDGFGMGLGFTFALLILGSIREILGSGALLGHKFLTTDGILMFVLAPGAFLVLGFVIALANRLQRKAA